MRYSATISVNSVPFSQWLYVGLALTRRISLCFLYVKQIFRATPSFSDTLVICFHTALMPFTCTHFSLCKAWRGCFCEAETSCGPSKPLCKHSLDAAQSPHRVPRPSCSSQIEISHGLHRYLSLLRTIHPRVTFLI